MAHTALVHVPAFLPSNVVLSWFFEANIEKKREKDVEHNMSTLVLLLSKVLMLQIVASSQHLCESIYKH